MNVYSLKGKDTLKKTRCNRLRLFIKAGFHPEPFSLYLSLHYYIHFQTNALEKGMNSLIYLAMS